MIFQDDGFATTAAEPWVRDKINIIQQYLQAAVVSLAGKVDDIVLVDLFAGNGLYSLGSEEEVFPGIALHALGLELPVSKFVLCERNPEQLNILKIRVNRYFRRKNVALLDGRPEDLADKLSLYVPQSRGDYKVAVLCVCDPFSLDVSFDMLERLSGQGFSFLMPLTLVLNDRLNYRHYLGASREKIKKYLGSYGDLEELEQDLENNVQFYKRLVRILEGRLATIGVEGAISAHKLDSGLMEMPMYYFGFFSQHFSVKAIQQEIEAGKNVQFDLF